LGRGNNSSVRRTEQFGQREGRLAIGPGQIHIEGRGGVLILMIGHDSGQATAVGGTGHNGGEREKGCRLRDEGGHGDQS